MKKFCIAAIGCAALLAIVILQRRTICELESRLAQPSAEKPRSKSTQWVPPAQLVASSTNIDPPALATNAQPRAQLEAEVLHLRGLAARTIRAEAELAQIQAAKATSSVSATVASTPEAWPEPMAAYLGQPVSPPQNLSAAYQREGLLGAIQSAAQGAGISLKKVEIDTSEFPYLIGFVANGADDFEKLKAQLKQNAQYEYNGGVSGDGRYAINITPSRFNPPESSQRIRARTLLRQNMLFDSLAK